MSRKRSRKRDINGAGFGTVEIGGGGLVFEGVSILEEWNVFFLRYEWVLSFVYPYSNFLFSFSF